MILLNPCEPCRAKVHRPKPHDSTGVVSENEPSEPFLDMVWWYTKKRITSLLAVVPSPPASCTRKVQKVHPVFVAPRLTAVFLGEPCPREVHSGVQGVHSFGCAGVVGAVLPPVARGIPPPECDDPGGTDHRLTGR